MKGMILALLTSAVLVKWILKWVAKKIPNEKIDALGISIGEKGSAYMRTVPYIGPFWEEIETILQNSLIRLIKAICVGLDLDDKKKIEVKKDVK